MMYRFLAIVILLAAAAAVPGCKKQEPAKPAETAQKAQQEAPPVTQENLNQQVDNMEQEIQEDIAAEE